MIAEWLTFELEFLNDCELPKWKGRLIRGFIGMLLKRSYCKVPGIECESCPRNFFCPYGYIFRSTTAYLFLRKLKHFPKPFSLKPPLETKTMYRKGETLTFSIVLFGRAAEFCGHIVEAVIKGSLLGIGRKGKRGKYKVRKIILENPLRGKKEILYEDGNFFNAKARINYNDLNKRINKIFTIRFLTPFRIIKEGKFVACPDFKDIFPFMMRKYSTILRAYCGIEPEENFRELKEAAEDFETVSRNLRAVLFIYTKNRTAYKEYYLIGEIKFRAPTRVEKPIRKIINFGILSNIGKRTTFGHGWYTVM